MGEICLEKKEEHKIIEIEENSCQNFEHRLNLSSLKIVEYENAVKDFSYKARLLNENQFREIASKINLPLFHFNLENRDISGNNLSTKDALNQNNTSNNPINANAKDTSNNPHNSQIEEFFHLPIFYENKLYNSDNLLLLPIIYCLGSMEEKIRYFTDLLDKGKTVEGKINKKDFQIAFLLLLQIPCIFVPQILKNLGDSPEKIKLSIAKSNAGIKMQSEICCKIFEESSCLLKEDFIKKISPLLLFLSDPNKIRETVWKLFESNPVLPKEKEYKRNKSGFNL